MLAAPIESLESLTLDMPLSSSANTGEAPKTPLKLAAGLCRSGADKGDVAKATPRSTAGMHLAAEHEQGMKRRKSQESGTCGCPISLRHVLLLWVPHDVMRIWGTFTIQQSIEEQEAGVGCGGYCKDQDMPGHAGLGINNSSNVNVMMSIIYDLPNVDTLRACMVDPSQSTGRSCR